MTSEELTELKNLVEQFRRNPSSVTFRALCNLLTRIGYVQSRVRGSHQIWSRSGFPMVNIQNDGHMAKPYQVRQIVRIAEQIIQSEESK